MAKEPFAGQPDELDEQEIINDICMVLIEHKLEDHIKVPAAILAAVMWEHAKTTAEGIGAFMDFMMEADEEQQAEAD
jgi:hypothetical protein